MQPGTKPKPVELKLIEGNPGRRPLNINEFQPDKIAPECPEWLLDEAKEEWGRMSIILESLGILTQVDQAAFAGYCQSYAKWVRAEKFLKEHGTTYRIPKKDKDGKVVSVYIAPFPEVAIAKSSLEQVRQFCSEFGLTPSSRSRISLPKESNEDLIDKMCTKN